jgi:hypothetical protein
MTRAWWLRIVIGVLAGASFVLAWSVERSSLERGNRLQRSGEYRAAADLYTERTRTDAVNPELRYNLGTALAQGDDPSAEDELARATLAPDPDVRGLAHYNTGVLRLDRALYAEVADSVRIHAAASVAANRLALRMRPDDNDAKWNLAMALRLLDSVSAQERRSGREITEGAVEADVVTRSVNVPDAEEDERAEDPPAQGESETTVVLGDETPLSPDQAAEILGRSHLDPTLMLTKLLALESRSRFGRRPSRGARRW